MGHGLPPRTQMLLTIMNTTSSIIITLAWMALWTTTCIPNMLTTLIVSLAIVAIVVALAYTIITNSCS